MSKFYGQVDGMSSTVASRRGSTYIKSSAQSYDGSVVVKLNYNSDGDLIVRVGAVKDESTSELKGVEFVDTFDKFVELLQLKKDIDEGKVSITRHREKSNKQLALERAFGRK